MRKLLVSGQWSSQIVAAEPVELMPGQVRVRIAYCGVCHSEIGIIGDADVTPGSGLGHELSGVVTESKSARFQAEDRVVVLHYEGYASEVVADRNLSRRMRPVGVRRRVGSRRVVAG